MEAIETPILEDSAELIPARLVSMTDPPEVSSFSSRYFKIGEFDVISLFDASTTDRGGKRFMRKYLCGCY